MMINTTKPIQHPTIKPSLLVRTEAKPIELCGIIDSFMRLPGSSRVTTEVHLLVGESTIWERMDSLKVSSEEYWRLSFSGLMAMRALGPAGPRMGQSPRPRTQMTYLVNDFSLFSFVERADGSRSLPRIWNKETH